MLTLASICLNEEEFIEAWLAYHYHAFDRISDGEEERGARHRSPGYIDRESILGAARPEPQHRAEEMANHGIFQFKVDGF
jgi:hypothetical protein